ncbi:hypothetical protein DNTS_032373 [Danionella cerebrum]|uniref:Uncharacterized protein n=1 Tax=Danionella cerebrum TaxID=2873325 RepID=A0A553QU78_9TELE|nr:hypothetical protein DNTS_032373 [Danionella translucida]
MDAMHLLRGDLVDSYNTTIPAETIGHLPVIEATVLIWVNAQFPQTYSNVNILQMQESSVKGGYKSLGMYHLLRMSRMGPPLITYPVKYLRRGAFISPCLADGLSGVELFVGGGDEDNQEWHPPVEDTSEAQQTGIAIQGKSSFEAFLKKILDLDRDLH